MRICKVKGCNRAVHGHGYCHRHWQQQYRGGEVLERTRYDDPVIRVEDEIAFITIFDKREHPILDAIIDVEDIPKVKNFKWSMHCNGYVNSKVGGLLHRRIAGATKGQLVDHINRNKLDNRKANLRIATRSMNVHNSKIPSTNRTGVKGVCLHKQTGKWEASIIINKIKRREYFAEFSDAVARRLVWENEVT